MLTNLRANQALLLEVEAGSPTGTPDDSTECITCKQQISDLDIKWTNATT